VGGYLGVVASHKVPHKLRGGLRLDGIPDLPGQPLGVGHVVQGDEAGGERQTRLLCQVVQEGPAVVLAGCTAAVLVQGPVRFMFAQKL